MGTTFADAARRWQPKKGPACSVCHMLSKLPDKDRAEVDEAMALPQEELASTAIRQEMLKREWNPPGIDMIRRHRRGDCKAGQP